MPYYKNADQAELITALSAQKTAEAALNKARILYKAAADAQASASNGFMTQ